MIELPRWAMGDPAKVAEHLEGIRNRPTRQERAKERLDRAFSEGFMTQDESDQIEELVMTWYHWAKAGREHLGYSRVSPMFRDMDRSDVYTDPEEYDLRIAAAQAEQVDVCLNQLPAIMRSAVGIHAANQDAGGEVYRNPRLTREEQHRVYQEAKEALYPMLRKRDMVKIAA